MLVPDLSTYRSRKNCTSCWVFFGDMVAKMITKVFADFWIPFKRPAVWKLYARGSIKSPYGYAVSDARRRFMKEFAER